MLALYRSGRQGDALAAFRQARQVLVDELGAEPGTELRDLRQRMLAADPALALTGPGPGPASGAAVLVTPRELPGTAAHFTGRGAELAALTRQLGELAGRPTGRSSSRRSAERRAWARRPWPCAGRTRSPAGSRTGSSTRTCMATIPVSR
jgi:hypothetical protein